MRNWFLINLGDAMLAYDLQDKITATLLSAYEDAGNPDNLAAFIRHESEGRLHCEVKIYLSPMSFNIAKSLNAQPCEKPSSDSLSMLAGTQSAWQLLFPERDY